MSATVSPSPMSNMYWLIIIILLLVIAGITGYTAYKLFGGG
jgi:uncharacterized membrane protein YdbT with pleckstrin-like domain